MVEDLIESLEDAFGKYKPGMKKAIKRKLSGIDSDSEKTLYRGLTEDYDLARPPSLKVIMGEMYKNGINVANQGYGGMSICEFCQYEYDQELVNCPKCGKIRKYGIIKLYKMGEGIMHPFNIQERKEKRKAMEPSEEEIQKFNEFLAHTGGLKGLLKDKIKNIRMGA